MRLGDLLELALGNLRRIKLRALLTVAGVIIAIATFVAMLSFAAGNQKYVTDAYRQFGLLSSMRVYPADREAVTDSLPPVLLDGDAVRQLQAIPGVEIAFPYVNFAIEATVGDTTVNTTARALSIDATRTPLFARILGDAVFSDDDAREAIVTRMFAEMIDCEDPDALVGERLIVSAEVASLDSALAYALAGGVERWAARVLSSAPDSLIDSRSRERLIRREMGEGLERFAEGFFRKQTGVHDTLTIIAVGPDLGSYRFSMAPVIVPVRTARRIGDAGIHLGGDPASLLSSLQRGRLFAASANDSGRTFPQVTLQLEPRANATAVKDSVEALGLRAFSYAEQFDVFRRFLRYYYAGLGVIGLIALVTASLGIVNTMVMSITERRREIGLLAALGADDRDIRRLFLVESGAIGVIGSATGILVGWLGTRIVSAIMKAIMEREEMLVFEPFALPFWLVLLSFAFGLGVSLLAGLYPAMRAARVDPIEALRAE